MLLLQPVALVLEKNDEWIWGLESWGNFSTKSAYLLLEKQDAQGQSVGSADSRIYKVLWKCKIPTKVLTFSWQMLLEKILTKLNLVKRGLSLSAENQLCVFCNNAAESEHSTCFFGVFGFTLCGQRSMAGWILRWYTLVLLHNFFCNIEDYSKERRRKIEE